MTNVTYPYESKLSVVKRYVSEEFMVPLPMLCGKCRRAEIVRPRHAAFYLAYKLTGASTTTIGYAFGDRDHATVLHGVKRTKAWMERDDGFRATVERLEGELRAVLVINGGTRQAIDDIAAKVRSYLTKLATEDAGEVIEALAELDHTLKRRKRRCTGGKAAAIALAFTSALLAAPATSEAQALCGPRAEVRAYVQVWRSQQPVAEMLTGFGNVVETWVGADRNWSMVNHTAIGLSCLFMEGKDYEGPLPSSAAPEPAPEPNREPAPERPQ